jgi:tetratricopeptide (TPR) repeat protein
MRNSALAIFVIILFGVIGYANTFSSPFQWDEHDFILNNPLITDLNNFLHPFETYDFPAAFSRRYTGFLSFALNYHFDVVDVTGYHIVNLLIHLTCAILLFYLIRLTFRTPYMDGSRLGGKADSIALFAALVFVSHPVQTEAVTYVFQRLASLAALFCLLALVAYLRSRLVSDRKTAWALYAFSLVSTVLAMKTKENAFTLPVMLALFEFLFFRGAVRPRVIRLVPLLMTMLIIPLSFVGASEGSAGILQRLASATRGYLGLTRAEYLTTQFRVVVTYLRLLVLPVNQNIDYHYPLYSSLFAPKVLASFMLLAGLSALGLYLIAASRAKDPALRLIGSGVLWFFLTLSVESSVIPSPMVINEYRLYLPSVGMFVAAGTGLGLLMNRVKLKHVSRLIVVLIVLVPLVLVLATHLRNETWIDDVRLWQDAAEKSPLSDRVHYNLANNYLRKGLAEEAIEQYRIALRLNPAHAGAHNNLGNALFDRSREEEATEHFRSAIAADPNFADAYNNLGNVYLSVGKLAEAKEQYMKALALRPDSSLIRLNLGIAFFNEGSYEEALRMLMEAEPLNPQDADIQFYLGRTYLEVGNIREARLRLEKTLLFDPADREAARLLQRLSDNK